MMKLLWESDKSEMNRNANHSFYFPIIVFVDCHLSFEALSVDLFVLTVTMSLGCQFDCEEMKSMNWVLGEKKKNFRLFDGSHYNKINSSSDSWCKKLSTRWDYKRWKLISTGLTEGKKGWMTAEKRFWIFHGTIVVAGFYLIKQFFPCYEEALLLDGSEKMLQSKHHN